MNASNLLRVCSYISFCHSHVVLTKSMCIDVSSRIKARKKSICIVSLFKLRFETECSTCFWHCKDTYAVCSSFPSCPFAAFQILYSLLKFVDK